MFTVCLLLRFCLTFCSLGLGAKGFRLDAGDGGLESGNDEECGPMLRSLVEECHVGIRSSY